MKKVVAAQLLLTGTPSSTCASKLFDTGFRSCSSIESSGLGGAAHLVNFKTTNTVAAIVHAAEYYKEDGAGISMPSSEYATMTTWGGRDHEMEACKNLMS